MLTKENSRSDVLQLLFAAVLACSVFPLGANRVFAASAVSLVLLVLLLVQFILAMIRGEGPLHRISVAWLAALPLATYVCWVGVQAYAPEQASLSADVHGTRLHLLMSVGYLAAFCLVLMQTRSDRSLRRLVETLVLFGLLQAMFAIYLYSARAQYELFHFAVDHSGRTLGTFSYHNSLANYLVVCLCLGIGLLVSCLDGPPGAKMSWRTRLLRVLNVAFSEMVRLRVMLLVMVVALVLTKSRMGNAAFMLVLLFVAAPVLVSKGHLRFKGAALVLSIIVLDVFFVGKLVGFDEVAHRLNKTGIESVDGGSEESVEDRSAPARLAIEMVKERPWAGRGAGSFYTTFPQYASSNTRMYYDHAHNDYIQFLVEVGVVGTGLLAVAVISTIFRTISVIRRPLTSSDMGIALGVLMAVLAVLIQASVDFHFQIPANALLVVTVLAIPWLLRRQPKPHA